MNRNKQLVINMSAQIIAFVVNAGISFFLTPYIVKNVGSIAYGFVGLANNFINYATIITAALNSMAGRFITISIHQERYEDTNKYFTSLIVANAGMSAVLTVVAVFILLFLNKLVEVPNDILGDVTLLWGLLFANFIIGLVMNVFSVATFSKNRLELSSLRNIESNIIKIFVLVVTFVFFKPHVWYLGLAALVCGIYVIILNMYYTKKLLPFVKIKRKYLDFFKIKELIFSGVWNSVSHISSTLSNGLDLLITNLFVSATAMGIVSIAKTLPSMILSVFGMLASVFMPQLTISYAKNDYKDIKKQLFSAVKLLGFFSCIPMAFLFAYGKEFFSLWMPDQNADLLQKLSILGSMAFPLCLPLEPLWNIFTVTNKVKQSSLFLFSNAVITIITVFVMLKYTSDENMKMYIIIGVSSVISVIRALTFLSIYGSLCLNFKWYTFYPLMLKNAIAVAVTTIVSLFIKKMSYLQINSWSTLIIDSIIMMIIACCINFFTMLGKDERNILKRKIFDRGDTDK